MTTEYIIKKLKKHGYKVSRCMASGRIALEHTERYGLLIMCDSYADAYKKARARHCETWERWN